LFSGSSAKLCLGDEIIDETFEDPQEALIMLIPAMA
jgi:hypothetical protein